MSVSGSAREKLIDEFIRLLERKPYNKITVTELCRAAGVNRATFYNNFEDIPDLFNSVCEEIGDYISGSGKAYPADGDAADKQAFYLEWVARMGEKMPELLLLAGEHGDVEFAFTIGQKIAGRFRGICERGGELTDFDSEIIRCLPVYVAMGIVVRRTGRENERAAWLDNSHITVDPELNLLENMSIGLSVRWGGTAEFHLTLLQAACKLLNVAPVASFKYYDMIPKSFSVTLLLKAAGISRTEFYNYYSNLDDFLHKVIEAVGFVVSQTIVLFCTYRPYRVESGLTRYMSMRDISFIKQATDKVKNDFALLEICAFICSDTYYLLEKHLKEAGRPVRTPFDPALAFYVCSTFSILWDYYYESTTWDMLEKRTKLLSKIEESLGI